MRGQIAVCAAALLSCSADGSRTQRQPADAGPDECGVKGNLGPGGDASLIVTGEDADVCEWRWHVGLRDAGPGTEPRAGPLKMPFCGGALIKPEWVLTAAHCVRDLNIGRIEVVAGKHTISNSTSNEQVRSAVEVIEHPDFNGRHIDLALVKLARPMDMNGCVGTVCPPASLQDVRAGSKCWITGWGLQNANGKQSDVLQEAEVTIKRNDDCWLKWEDHKPDAGAEYNKSHLHWSMLCAQGVNPDGNFSDSCLGDSGGLLVCPSAQGAWSLYGVTSSNWGCTGEPGPGIYSKVDQAEDWIREIIGGNQPPTALCPGRRIPDADGNCDCGGHSYCWTAGGSWCPSFRRGGVFPHINPRFFKPDCTDCKCHYWLR